MQGNPERLRTFHTEFTERQDLTTEGTEVILGFLRVLCEPTSASSV
jgi:hypothetical protein